MAEVSTRTLPAVSCLCCLLKKDLKGRVTETEREEKRHTEGERDPASPSNSPDGQGSARSFFSVSHVAAGPNHMGCFLWLSRPWSSWDVNQCPTWSGGITGDFTCYATTLAPGVSPPPLIFIYLS